MFVNCVMRNCKAVQGKSICRQCMDDLEDKTSPSTWDGKTKISTHQSRTLWLVSCLTCGELVDEVLLTELEVRRHALTGERTDDGLVKVCPKCSGWLMLEPAGSGLMETTTHLRPPDKSRNADLRGN